MALRTWRCRVYRALEYVPWLTLSLAFAVVAVDRLKDSLGGFGPWVSVVSAGGSSLHRLLDGELYRLVSASFVHWDREHLTHNLGALLFVGPLVELSLGRGWMLALLLVSSVATYGLFALLSPATVACGLSAPLFGFLGGYLGAWLAPAGLAPGSRLPQTPQKALLFGTSAAFTAWIFWRSESAFLHGTALVAGALFSALLPRALHVRTLRGRSLLAPGLAAIILACGAWPLAEAELRGRSGLEQTLQRLVAANDYNPIWLNETAWDIAKTDGIEQGALEIARTAARRAVDLGNDPAAWDTLAAILGRQGDMQQALAAQLQATRRGLDGNLLARLARFEEHERTQRPASADHWVHEPSLMLFQAAVPPSLQITADQLPRTRAAIDVLVSCSGNRTAFVRSVIEAGDMVRVPLEGAGTGPCWSAKTLRVDADPSHWPRHAWQLVWLDSALKPPGDRAIWFSTPRPGVVGHREVDAPFAALATAH